MDEEKFAKVRPDSGPKPLSKLSRDEMLAFCRRLYEERGVAAFAYPALRKVHGLYTSLYELGLRQKVLLRELGIEDEYKAYTRSQPMKYGGTLRDRWSWELVIARARAIFEQEGRLPSAIWFQKNGHASLIQALYSLGHTWDQLRAGVGDTSTGNFVASRSGLRWLSHAEASLSNFLYARGIEHKKGERYDDRFSEVSGAKYAIYDLHFRHTNGAWVDVEVWGDRPNGHNEERYAQMRRSKERFNVDNPRFLGVHHEECYDEAALTRTLAPHIGVIVPFRFDKQTDALLQSTHWSNADELLDFCKHVASSAPGGEFPAEDWLRKRGKWVGRDGPAYNTLSVYIKKWLGGVRNLRRLIGQADVSTQQWDRELALKAYRDFYNAHGMTPHQARHERHRKNNMSIPDEVVLEAGRISSAIEKYAGGIAAANAALGLDAPKRTKWSKAELLKKIEDTFEQWGRSPNQLLRDHRMGRVTLPAETTRVLGQVIDAVSRYPGGIRAIYAELGRSALRRPHQERRRASQRTK